MKPPDDENARDVPPLDVDPSEFPALEDFFLGYLHQDFEIEYGDAAEAMDAFIADASQEERALIRRDWAALRSRFEHVDEEHRLRLLERLGACWQPVRWAQVEDVFARLGGAADDL